MEFKLNVAFTSAQLDTIYAAGSNVIVAKPSADGSNPNVAWLVFRPLNSNQITWEEEYGIYCTTSQIINGTVLSQLSSVPVPAIDNKLYTLQASGAIKGPDTGGSPDTFSILNQYSGQQLMTVGLYQNANVNGTAILKSAISAAPVLLASTAAMTPFTTVYIWLQSNVKGNCVVTTVTSPMTKLLFGDGIDEISVSYDSTSGTFIPTPSRKNVSSKRTTEIELVEALFY